MALEFAPLTPGLWDDLEALFGPNGACSGCWCMWWRLKRSEFDRLRGDGTRAAFAEIVARGDEPGVLAYSGGAPVGWCSVAPRSAFGVLQRSRVLAPVDDVPVWSIVCLFVDRSHRRAGVSRALVEAAVAHSRAHHAPAVEAYPRDAAGRRLPAVSAFTGVVPLYADLGFVEVARRSPVRPVMRLDLP